MQTPASPVTTDLMMYKDVLYVGTGDGDITGLALETGLYYYRARYYDPNVGRFAGEDPMGFYEATDFYVFVDNNPLNLIDPSGLAPGDK